MQKNLIDLDREKTEAQIVNLIQNSSKKLNKIGAVVGLSGGIDSTVVAYLAARALGQDKIFGLILPERDSYPQSKIDALLVANSLKIKAKTISLTQALKILGCYDSIPAKVMKNKYSTYFLHQTAKFAKGKQPFIQNLKGSEIEWLNQAIAFYRIKHRLRMVVLHLFAEKKNLLVLGCANKSETSTGFFVRYGDDSADILPLLHLFKTQVYQLAHYLKIPEKIIIKAPSPDLLSGLNDEKLLGITYKELDPILYLFERKTTPEKISETLNIPLKKVQYVKQIVQASRHMRETPYFLQE